MFKNRIGIAANNPKTQNQNKRTGFINGFSAFNNNHKRHFFQSITYGSDYQRAAVSGVCQDSQQQAEYICFRIPQHVPISKEGFMNRSNYILAKFGRSVKVCRICLQAFAVVDSAMKTYDQQKVSADNHELHLAKWRKNKGDYGK